VLFCGRQPTTLWETRAMTKKEIVKDISEEIGLTQLKTKEIVQKTFDAIVKTLVEDGRIELRNFGVFEVKKRAARKARNPRTGDKVFVPEKFVVTFKPGKEMEERVRQLEEEAARKAMQEHHKQEGAMHVTPTNGQFTPGAPAPVPPVSGSYTADAPVAPAPAAPETGSASHEGQSSYIPE
jgi:integration host factor subunit beta